MTAELPQTDLTQLPDELPAGLVVLDVREPDEWSAGHIEGAVHIPMWEVPGRLAEVPADGQVLVVCKVGSRSARVAGYLRAQGVDAVNLAGGLVAWDAAGRPMVAESGARPFVL